jgi:hypothetical protein
LAKLFPKISKINQTDFAKSFPFYLFMVKQQNLSAKQNKSAMGMEGGSTKRRGGGDLTPPPYPGHHPLSWFWANPKSVFSLLNPFFGNLLEEDNKLKTTWYNTNPTPHDIHT